MTMPTTTETAGTALAPWVQNAIRYADQLSRDRNTAEQERLALQASERVARALMWAAWLTGYTETEDAEKLTARPGVVVVPQSTILSGFVHPSLQQPSQYETSTVTVDGITFSALNSRSPLTVRFTCAACGRPVDVELGFKDVSNPNGGDTAGMWRRKAMTALGVAIQGIADAGGRVWNQSGTSNTGRFGGYHGCGGLPGDLNNLNNQSASGAGGATVYAPSTRELALDALEGLIQETVNLAVEEHERAKHQQ